MATGRMIQRRISNNKDLPRLVSAVDSKLGTPHGAFAALLYTWSIAHLDVEGRMHGDPEVVKGTVVPRVSGITPDSIRVYLESMAELGLVYYYEANGDLWLAFPGFDAAQPGLRKDRETSSVIPAPAEGRSVAGALPESIRSDTGSTPSEVKEKVREEKRKEDLPHAHARVDLGSEQKAWVSAWHSAGLDGSPMFTSVASEWYATPEQRRPDRDAVCVAYAQHIKAMRSTGRFPRVSPEGLIRDWGTVLAIARGEIKAADISRGATKSEQRTVTPPNRGDPALRPASEYRFRDEDDDA